MGIVGRRAVGLGTEDRASMDLLVRARHLGRWRVDSQVSFQVGGGESVLVQERQSIGWMRCSVDGVGLFVLLVFRCWFSLLMLVSNL